MVWGPLISAGASLIGGLVSARGADRAASRSEEFSREMYDYALTHGPSLEMAGLRRAGINPMLRYGTGGQGTPVSMPTMSFPNPYQGLSEGVAGAASSAFGTMRLEQEIDESRARTKDIVSRLLPDIERIQANTALTDAQRATELRRPGLIMQDIMLKEAQTFLTEEQMNVFGAQIRQMNAAAFASMMSGYLSGQMTSTEIERGLREHHLAISAGVQRDRDVTMWRHDQQMLEDEVVGWFLRAARNISAAVQGR